MFEYFYHEILRRTIISFGTLFNGLNIKHKDSDENTTSVIKVPLAYGPTQKFLARLEQQADLYKAIQITLPRMSFEFQGLTYDPTRKVTTTQTFLSGVSSDKATEKKTYMPVPYNMNFELSLMCKLNDDALQLVEQIVPYFQPAYSLSVDLVSTIGFNKTEILYNIVQKRSRGAMDITRVFGTWIWGSSPFETARKILI